MIERPLRIVAVVDGTSGVADRQARALGGFLREGLTVGAGEGPTVGVREGPTGDAREGPGGIGGESPAAGASVETLVFYDDTGEKDRLVELSPTGDTRLVRTGSRRVDLMLGSLVGEARGEQPTLFLFASGPTGTELATRLACRTGGAALTEVLNAEGGAAGLVCRKNVYSAHMTGRFELTSRPWCVSIDVAWCDAVPQAPVAHHVVSEHDETGETGPPPFDDIELIGPSDAELAETRFLVVAGHGMGDHKGVERIAAAARRMGADFGVTRPVATNAWAPMDRLIGASGTRTAPALCVVAGASGAPAFQWGIEKAGFIVAVNPDERAALARNADAVVLDDGVAVVEALADLIAKQRGGW